MLVRAASAADPHIDPDMIWPVQPCHCGGRRSRGCDEQSHGLSPWATMPPGSWQRERVDATMTRHVQVWSLSDLRLRSTLELPVSPQGKRYDLPDEPRLLPDGSVYVNTFTCGLYRMTQIADLEPRIEFVYSFPGGDSEHTLCGVPVVMGRVLDTTSRGATWADRSRYQRSCQTDRGRSAQSRPALRDAALDGSRPSRQSAGTHWPFAKLGCGCRSRCAHREAKHRPELWRRRLRVAGPQFRPRRVAARSNGEGRGAWRTLSRRIVPAPESATGERLGQMSEPKGRPSPIGGASSSV